MRSAPVRKSIPPAIEEIRRAKLARDINALTATIERFIATPSAERMDGATVLCALLDTELGKHRFLNDAHWRAVITPAELNEPDYFDRNALSIMSMTAGFINLIDDDESFRQKITAKGFCWGGHHSAAFQFLVYTEKLKLMIKHRDLWGKITIEFFNVVTETATFSKTMPVIYELTHHHEGIKFLAMLPELIREDGLNETSVYSSALKHLCYFPEGVDLLHQISVRKKIQANALNKIDERDASSVVSMLAKTPRGCELLDYPDIAKKVAEEALRARAGHGMPAVFHMVKCLEGLHAIASHQCYRRVIQLEDMNLICRSGEDTGTSILFWLLLRKEGRDIILNSWHLRRCIDTSQLLTVAESGEFKGLSPLDLLRLPENQTLLSKLNKDVQVFVNEKLDASMKRMLSNRSHSGLFLHVEKLEDDAAMQPVEVLEEAEEPRRHLGCRIL